MCKCIFSCLFFDNVLNRKQASFIIEQVIHKGVSPESLFGKKNQELLNKLQNEYGELKKSPISAYYGGSYARKKEVKKAKKSKAKEC